MVHRGVVPADICPGAQGGCVYDVEVRMEGIEGYFQQRSQVVTYQVMQVEPHASSGLGIVNQFTFPEDWQAVCWSSSLLTV